MSEKILLKENVRKIQALRLKEKHEGKNPDHHVLILLNKQKISILEERKYDVFFVEKKFCHQDNLGRFVFKEKKE